MTFITLIPAVVCIVALFVWPLAKVFRNVVLPVILLLPLFYVFKAPLLPPIDFGDAVMLPLGIAIVVRNMRGWHYSLIDLWVLLFLLSTCVADRLSGFATASIFELFDRICYFLIPYMIGKMLIEQDGNRAATIRRIVVLMFVAAIPSFYEPVGRDNPYRMVFQPRLFPTSIWLTQIRNGYGRISGPYTQAELAGMTFLVGIVLALFLARYYGWGERFLNATWLPVRRSTVVIGVLLLALVLTQSRGPELGVLIAIPIALVGRSRRVLRSIFLAIVFAAVVGSVGYIAVTRYAETRQTATEDQSSVVYRQVMLEHYVPMAEHSGTWGFGLTFHPISGQASIDNEYLWVWLTQGYVGILSFLLMLIGTLYNLVMAAIYNPRKVDRSFAFTLLGILCGLLFITATVFLGDQPLILFSMIVGWAQSVRVRPQEGKYPVFERVYT